MKYHGGNQFYLRALYLFFIVLISGASAIQGATFYVDQYATGNNNGTSWTNAWTNLAAAMTSTPSDNTIHVAEGTYVAPAGGWSPVNNNLTLEARTGDDVILSGDLYGNDIEYDLMEEPCAMRNAFFYGDRADNTRILVLANKNMTINGLTFKSGTAYNDGGLIHMSGTTDLTLNDCWFTQSYADDDGGAIYHDSSGTLTATDCRFTQCSSLGEGSFIYASNTGGLYLTGCLFQVGWAIDNAGCVCPGRYSLSNTITDCVFDRCRMKNNTSGSAGIMARFDVDSVLTVTNCLFKQCNTYHHGAAVYLRARASCHPIANITNCLVTGSTNYQMTGSDVALHAEAYSFEVPVTATMNLTNCTVAGNHTNGQGHIGGWTLFNNNDNTVTINLKNCIVWGNTGGSDNTNNAQLFIDPYSGAPSRVFINADYCCWDNSDPNDWGHSQSLGTDNLLKTDIPDLYPGFVNAVISDFHLQPDSVCIDTGDPTSDFGLEPEPDGGRVNMGAYGNTPEATTKGGLLLASYNLVSKTRINRNTFEYAYTMTLNNSSDEDVSNVVVTLLDASDNVTIVDSQVSFSSIAAETSAVSDDTFTIRVDRSEPIDVTTVSWRAEFATGIMGMSMQSFTTNLDIEPMDTSGYINLKVFSSLARYWLEQEPSVNLVGSDLIDIEDLAELAIHWLDTNE